MEKEDILRLSRNAHEDEGMQYVRSQGRIFGIIGMVGILVFLSIYYLYAGQHENVFPLLTMMFGYLSFESYGIFKATQNRKKMASCAIAAILCVIFLTMTLV